MSGEDVADPVDDGKEPQVRVLHRGERYAVRFVHANDAPWAVVSFEYWKPAPTLDGEFSGEGFFRHRRMNAFGIMAASNDWFQHAEIEQALAAIRAAAPGWRLIGYGGSMGGYAAINFADQLGLASLVAVIPQFSIDAARAPYEPRWRAEAASLDFARDRIAEAAPMRAGWLIYDPWCTDARHVADIQRRHAYQELRVPFGGHAIMLMLQQADVYTDMFTDMLAERFDAAAFRRRWRTARRHSAAYWLGLAEALGKRGNPRAALRAVAYARALPHPDPAWFDLIEADQRLACGEPEAARHLAGLWAAHPAFGGPARERLNRLPPEPQAPDPPASPPRPLWRRAIGRAIGRAIRRALGRARRLASGWRSGRPPA